MKAYVLTTGIVFGLLALAHIWRIFEEGAGPARNPWFVVTTLGSASLCLWSWRVARTISRR